MDAVNVDYFKTIWNNISISASAGKMHNWKTIYRNVILAKMDVANLSG